jgi:site-specific DNA recombinase
MFAWVGCENCSLYQVARRLERLGVRTRHGLTRWNRVTIWGMLRNPAYRGEAAYGRRRRGERRPRARPRRGQPQVPKSPQSSYEQPASEHIRIAVPALVDAHLFDAVAERLEENRRRLRQRQRGARYLLSGLLVCADCRYAVCGQSSSGGRGYYRCVGRDPYRCGGQPVCQSRTQLADDLDATVWKDASALLSEPGRLREEFERRQRRPNQVVSAGQKDRVRSAIVKVKQSISRLIDAYAEGLVDHGDFEPRVRRLRERHSKLETELRTLHEQIEKEQDLRLVLQRFDEFADQIRAGLDTADFTQRREILRALIKRVEVGPANIRIVYKVPPHPFVNGPHGGRVQDCWKLQRTSMHTNAHHLPFRVGQTRRHCNAQEGRGFGAKTAKLFIVGLILLNPLDSLIVPPACWFLVPQFPVGDGQEEPVEAVATVAELPRFLQRRHGSLPVAGPAIGRA